MELLYTLLVLLVLTRGFGELAERFRQPALTGELAAGILLGIVIARYSGEFPILAGLTEDPVFGSLTDLSIFFLMLYAGIELKPRELAETSGSAAVVALGGFLLPLGAGLALAWVVLPDSDLKLVQSLFLGTALAITAVPVAVKILIDLGELDSRRGKTIVSAALFDDVLSLMLLAVLVAFLSTGEPPSVAGLLLLAAKIAAFFALTAAFGMFVLPRVGRLIRKAEATEFEFSALLVLALGFSLLAEVLGLHFILGAFMAGLFFTRSTADRRTFEGLETKLSGITSGFFAPIFFASIGLHFSFGAIAEIPVFTLVLVVVAFLGKLLGAGVAAYATGTDARDAAAVGVAMSGRGAVELIIADIALSAGLFSSPDPPPPIVANLFSAVVLMAVVTTLLSPIALRRILKQS